MRTGRLLKRLLTAGILSVALGGCGNSGNGGTGAGGGTSPVGNSGGVTAGGSSGGSSSSSSSIDTAGSVSGGTSSHGGGAGQPATEETTGSGGGSGQTAIGGTSSNGGVKASGGSTGAAGQTAGSTGSGGQAGRTTGGGGQTGDSTGGQAGRTTGGGGMTGGSTGGQAGRATSGGGQSGGSTGKGGQSSSGQRPISFGTLLDAQAVMTASQQLAKSLANPSSSQWQTKGDQHWTYRFAEANVDEPYRICVPTDWDGQFEVAPGHVPAWLWQQRKQLSGSNNKQLVTLAQQHGYLLVSPLGDQGAYGNFRA